jgi:hypothetical protein
MNYKKILVLDSGKYGNLSGIIPLYLRICKKVNKSLLHIPKQKYLFFFYVHFIKHYTLMDEEHAEEINLTWVDS